MKPFLKCLLIGLLASMNVGVSRARADLEVSASVQIHAQADFYAPLATHGTWVEVGTYGRCWRPAGIAVEWRPYSYGHWVFTDCGWYWASDEPWGWACYHYGSWVYESDYGWVWVPGIEWAPAWVSWRFGGGYCGWAPLPPRGIVVAPRSFVFVEVGHFHDPVKPSTVIVNNTTIINKTTEIASIKHETRNLGGATPQKVVVNEGPHVDVIQKATGKKFSATPIREVASRSPVPPDAVNKINESRKNEKPDRPGPPNDGKVERKETPPAKVAPPDKGKEPPKDGIRPAPKKPPTPGSPDGKPPKRGKGDGKRPGKDKD